MNRLRWQRLRSAGARWSGWWRLRFGLCPFCNSSPPQPKCPVCHGSYEYGPRLPNDLRDQWQRRWAQERP